MAGERSDERPLPPVTIYTDGACLGNPGPGGYGAVLLHGEKRREISGGYRLTTNNRMEIMACIAALEALKKPCGVTLHSDSQYVVNSVSRGWAAKWKAKGWMRTPKDKAVNPDLWDRLLDLCRKHQVEFRWVRGHNGTAENERCDRLAVEAANSPGLAPDPGYAGKLR
ncbi:MAG: Ribonuclease [Dehalococcoidia bacterium]|nr:Ribonuclease [Dehalococcoidia bacterium]